MFSREFIDNFLNSYSTEEKEKIFKDLQIVKSITFDMARPIDSTHHPVYLATAGGPGSAKTTTLETYIIDNQLQDYVYADPDQVSLKNMSFTYRKSLSNYEYAKASSNYLALKFAYDKWRGASNYICHEMLQLAFGSNNGKDQRYSIAHGTTSTSPHIASLYQRIKSLGYKINLLLCYSQDETRKQSVIRREKEQVFVQTDPKEVISKGNDFPKRFDIYFTYADEIHFYWNDELTHGKLPTPCASLSNTSQGPILTIFNEPHWIYFCSKYLSDVRANNLTICEAFARLIPKDLLENEKAFQSPAPFEAVSSTESSSVHSGKIRFWGATDTEDKYLRNEVRPNVYHRS